MVQEELAAMLEMGEIEESNSAWCSPIVLVAKKDGTVRFLCKLLQGYWQIPLSPGSKDKMAL